MRKPSLVPTHDRARWRSPRLVSLVAATAASAIVVACSSSSAPPVALPDDAASDAALPEAGPVGETGTGAPQDAAVSPEVCDASLVLPTDGGIGSACSKCLEAKCASSLSTCGVDCLCIASLECLVVNDDNYTLCDQALSAIGAGNPGLTAVAGCIASSCLSACNGAD